MGFFRKEIKPYGADIPPPKEPQGASVKPGERSALIPQVLPEPRKTDRTRMDFELAGSESDDFDF